ncbi:hypothetical protein QYF36_011723 [Acer negundo]|nr:hypothetical protein QYF36_011723 [Acer negundo]
MQSSSAQNLSQPSSFLVLHHHRVLCSYERVAILKIQLVPSLSQNWFSAQCSRYPGSGTRTISGSSNLFLHKV